MDGASIVGELTEKLFLYSSFWLKISFKHEFYQT
jgi:hypothetical protein